MKIGYTTGTFDVPHFGHFTLLKNAKQFCDKLIVGLVTDALAIKQKRPPVMSFEQRKVILENCKWVDTVVAFGGTSKQTDYLKLKFDVLIIGDDYFGKEEYASFEREYPHVPVYYIPRTQGVSSSNLTTDLTENILDKTKVIAVGIGGPILNIGMFGVEYVIKNIPLGKKEYMNTKNIYDLSVPPPRVWKDVSVPFINIPFLAGVNSYRQIKAHTLLKNYRWYPIIKINIEECSACNFGSIKDERKFPFAVATLIQRNGGRTMRNILTSLSGEEYKDTLEKMIKKVDEVVKEMLKIDFVHGDLHPDNILFDKNMDITVVDYDWCYHSSFQMDTEERKYYQTWLDEEKDMEHFKKSLEYFGMMHPS